MRKGLVLAMLLSSSVAASDYDLKAAMQQMKLDFKQAAEAQTVSEMQHAMDSFSMLLDASKQATYPSEKQELYQEGFNRLKLSVDKINQQLEQGNLDAAQQQLRTIDQLREEYHDKRNPSIWSKIFG
nr:cytochrome b562 [Vibrio taketomensis]